MPTPSPDYDPSRGCMPCEMGQPKQTPMGDSVDMTQAETAMVADFRPVSLAEEKMRGGWTKTSTGAPGLPDPAFLQGGCGGGNEGAYATDESES